MWVVQIGKHHYWFDSKEKAYKCYSRMWDATEPVFVRGNKSS